MAGMLGHDEVERRMGYHKPTAETLELHKRLRGLFIDLGKQLDDLLPASRETALAQTALQEACQWSQAAVATNLSPLALGQ